MSLPFRRKDNGADASYKIMSDVKTLDSGKRDRGKDAHTVFKTVAVIIVVSVVVSVVLILTFSAGAGDLDAIWRSNQRFKEAYVNITESGAPMPPKWQIGVIGHILGQRHADMLSATMMSLLAFLCVVIATVTSTIQVIRYPGDVPDDFEEKGTLSNVAQETGKPNGRMFAVGLFTFALLLIMSDYTSAAHRPWACYVDMQTQPFNTPSFEGHAEVRFRTFWLLVPNVCFMFTATFPSLSTPTGLDFYLMLLHNICAPFGMAVVVIMETLQLSAGENAFSYFFSSDPTPIYGPLTLFQRARVCVVCFAWVAILVFLGVQVYLGLGSMLGVRIKTWYNLALISYSGEVIGLNLVALLPFLAGIGTLATLYGQPSVTVLAIVSIVSGTSANL